MSETLDIASFIERRHRVPVLDVRTPFEIRVERLVAAYGRYDTDRLVYRSASAWGACAPNRPGRPSVMVPSPTPAVICYYDTAYRHSLNKRNTTKQHHFDLPTPPTLDAFADQLLETTLV